MEDLPPRVQAEGGPSAPACAGRPRPSPWAAPTRPAKELGEINEFDGAATSNVAIPFQNEAPVEGTGEEAGGFTIEDVLAKFCTILRTSRMSYDRIPVYVNVYNIYGGNKHLQHIGLGIYHSAVDLFGYDVAFGSHDEDMTGVGVSNPTTYSHDMTLRDRILVGYTTKLPGEIADILAEIAREWPGNSYDLLTHNCNHFTDCLCKRLCGVGLPKYVNRIARVGAFFAGNKTGKGANKQGKKHGTRVEAQVSQAAHGELSVVRGSGQKPPRCSKSTSQSSTSRSAPASPEAPSQEFPPEMYFDDWDDDWGDGGSAPAEPGGPGDPEDPEHTVDDCASVVPDDSDGSWCPELQEAIEAPEAPGESSSPKDHEEPVKGEEKTPGNPLSD